MATVSVKLLHPRSGSPLTVTVPMVVAGPCSYCGMVGRLRCSECHAWYCTGHCQASHWPLHRRECVQPPVLVWPDGARYEGGEEVVVLVGEEEGEQEMTSMNTLVHVGHARLEQRMCRGGDTTSDEKSEAKNTRRESDKKSNGPKALTASKAIETTTANKTEVAATLKSAEADELIQKKVKFQPNISPAKLLGISTTPPPKTDSADNQPKFGQNVKQTAVPTAYMTTKQADVNHHQISKPKQQPTTTTSTTTGLHVKPAAASPQMVPRAVQISRQPPCSPTPTTTKSTPKQDAAPNTTKVLSNSQSLIPRPPPSPVAAKSPQPVAKPAQPTSIAKSASTAQEYTPVISSSTLPPQSPPSHLSQVVLPVDDITSPGQFGIRLVEQKNKLNSLLEKMLKSPPPAVQGWKIGRRETVAVMEQEIWYRGLAIRKMGEQFEVYLLDYGGLITVAADKMRPMPADCAVLPAFNYQVCMAGLEHRVVEEWGEVEENMMREILNSSLEYKLGVEFLGQVDGGRWAVRLRGVDVGQIMLGGELAVAREDVFIKREVVENARSPSVQIEAPALAKSTKPPSLPPPPTAATCPPPISVSRGVLSAGSEVVAVVCYLETPSVFYICPTTSVDQFTNVLTISQNCPPGQVSPAVGSCCLAQDDDCWYRAEIVQLSQDQGMVTVFLLDYGKKVVSSLTSLRPIPNELVAIQGLVFKVSLNGIEAVGKEWSKDEVDGAEIILDVGNDVTQFNVKVVEVDSNGEILVSMKDMEGNDVASLMVETGIAAAAKTLAGKEVDEAPLGYKAGCLRQGTQVVIMLKVVSPMELYLCSQEMFLQLSTSIATLEENAAQATPVISIKIGDPVLACDDGTWYRAKVTQMMADNKVQVELVDLASISTLPLSQLKKISPEVVKDNVVAVSCCLDTWVGEDRKMAMEMWGQKMAGMVEDYDELQVEVVGQEGGQFRVKIPELEKKLKGGMKSKAEMLKEKLRKK